MDWKAHVTRNVDVKWFETSWGCQSWFGIGLLRPTLWRSGRSIVMRLWRVSLLPGYPSHRLVLSHLSLVVFFYFFLKGLIQKWTSHGQPSSIHTPMQTIEVPHPEMSLSGSLLPFSWSLSCNSNGHVHPIKSYEPLTFHRWVSTIRLLSEATVSNPVSDTNLDHNVCVYSIQQNQCVSNWVCLKIGDTHIHSFILMGNMVYLSIGIWDTLFSDKPNGFYVFSHVFSQFVYYPATSSSDLRGVVLTRVLGRRGRGPVAVLQGAKMAIFHQASWDLINNRVGIEPPKTWELTQETRWHMEKSYVLWSYHPEHLGFEWF